MIGAEQLLQRVALVSTGLSHVGRGYEAFTQDLFDALSTQGPVTLLKGSGENKQHARTIPGLVRHHPLVKTLSDSEGSRYCLEQRTMAVGGMLSGDWNRYDIIHTCDPNFARMLWHFKNLFSLRTKILFANCGPLNPEHYKGFDHIQEFTPAYQQHGWQNGVESSQSTLIPMGIWPERFRTDISKSDLRAKYDIPDDAYVIITVASLDESFKRLTFLADVLGKAYSQSRNVFWLLAGNNQGTDTARDTLTHADVLLPDRFRHLSVPYALIPELYGASDLFILPSLQEGFGKVYLEAMAAGLPVLANDNDHTRWIMPADRQLIDMENPDLLLTCIRQFQANPAMAQDMAAANDRHLRERFTWDKLLPDYLAMYEKVLGQ